MKKKIEISGDSFPSCYYSPAKLCIYMDIYTHPEPVLQEGLHIETPQLS